MTDMAAPSRYDPRSEVRFTKCSKCGHIKQGRLHWSTAREECW